MPETSQTWPCLNVESALTTVEGSCKVQLRLRLGQADSYTTHQGESKHCCHPGQPIQSVGHKSARRPSSFGSGKMECDGLVFTNSGGAPSLRQASHHSPHSARALSVSPQYLVRSYRASPTTHLDTPVFLSLTAPHTNPSFMLLLLLSSSFISSVLLSRVHCCN